MSIETDLNRIATALEEIVKSTRQIVSLGNPGKPLEAPPALKTAAAKKSNPVPPLVVEEDFLGGGTEAQPTMEDVHAACQAFMEGRKGDIEATKALMIKYGAIKAKPTISGIPTANYAALIAEAKKG
jgi:hypothetical protein